MDGADHENPGGLYRKVLRAGSRPSQPHAHLLIEFVQRRKREDAASQPARYQMRRGASETAKLAAPAALGAAGGGVTVLVKGVDAHFKDVRGAGATILSEPADQPYGQREYAVRYPDGHTWWIAMPTTSLDASLRSASSRIVKSSSHVRWLTMQSRTARRPPTRGRGSAGDAALDELF